MQNAETRANKFMGRRECGCLDREAVRQGRVGAAGGRLGCCGNVVLEAFLAGGELR